MTTVTATYDGQEISVMLEGELTADDEAGGEITNIRVTHILVLGVPVEEKALPLALREKLLELTEFVDFEDYEEEPEYEN